MEATVIVGAISAVLGGGLGSVLTTVTQGRAVARKIDVEATAINAKTPAEVDSIALQGAESAVRVLQQTTQSLLGDNERLHTENARLRSQLEQMELRLEQAKHRADAAMEQLRLVQQDYDSMAAEMRTFRSGDPLHP